MIVLIDKDGAAYEVLSQLLGDNLVHFSDVVKAIASIRSKESQVSGVIYAFDANTHAFLASEMRAVKSSTSYDFPLTLIYRNHDSLKLVGHAAYDDVIHEDILSTLGVKKLKTQLEWKKAHNELIELRLSKDFYNERDELTGLPNHRKVVDVMHDYFRYSQRHERPFSAIKVSLAFSDHETATEDGSQISEHDRRLLGFSVALQEIFYRSMDVIGRLEGDNFIVLLPETDGAGLSVVQRRVEAVLAKRVEAGGVSGDLICRTYNFDNNRLGVDLEQRILSAIVELGV